MQNLFLCQGIGRLHFDEYAKAGATNDFNKIYAVGGFPSIPWFGSAGRKNSENLERYKLIGVQSLTTPFSYAVHYFLIKLFNFNPVIRNYIFYLASLIYSIEAIFCLFINANNHDVVILRSGYGGCLFKWFCNYRKIIIAVDCSLDRAGNIHKRIKEAGGSDEFFSEKYPFWLKVNFDIQNGDYVIFNSEFISKSFITTCSRVVELPVRQDLFASLKTVDKDKYKIVFAGDFCQRKGSFLIANLSKRLKVYNDKYKIHVFGEVTDRKSASNCADNVAFHGHVSISVLKDNIQNSSIFLFPTLGEGMARVLVEALHLEAKVVTTIYSGLPNEILEICHLLNEINVDSLFNLIISANSLNNQIINKNKFCELNYKNKMKLVFDDLNYISKSVVRNDS